MRLRNSKIRYYPVGLISILLIPLSYILADYKTNFFNEPLFKCCTWDPFSQMSVYKGYSSKINYTHINLTGIKSDDEAKIRNGKYLIRKHVKSKNPLSAIHFKLSDNLEFETVMEVLNMCKKEGAKDCFLTEGDIWILNPIQRRLRSSEFPMIYL